MKALVLNGSPRRRGTVATLLEAVTRSWPEEVEVERVDVCRAAIRPCIACMRCRETGRCVLPEDDGHRIGAKIAEADLLLVGTPTHWGNMSTPLKGLFDRNVPVFMGEDSRGMPVARQKGKPALIVTACTTPWPFDRILRESRGAIASVREVLHYGGYRVVGTVVKPGTKRKPDITERELATAAKLGRRLLRAGDRAGARRTDAPVPEGAPRGARA